MNTESAEIVVNQTAAGFFNRVKTLYLKSIKPLAADEPIVAFFFRPIGFLIAMAARFFKMTPNMITVVRIVTGIAAGVYFFIGTPQSIAIGGIILFISTFFDVADGQLARITERYSRMGTFLDGTADGLTLGLIYIATACLLTKSAPETGAYWWILTALAAFSFLMHLNSFAFLRHDYMYYILEKRTELRESFEKINDDLQKVKAYPPVRRLGKYILMGMKVLFNIIFMELASKILLHKKYQGYTNWYAANNDIDYEKKELFKANYKKYNGWIAPLFGNLGLGSNLLVFTIAALFNRLDIGIYVILFGFNAYYLIMILIQQISFRWQVKKAGL